MYNKFKNAVILELMKLGELSKNDAEEITTYHAELLMKMFLSGEVVENVAENLLHTA